MRLQKAAWQKELSLKQEPRQAAARFGYVCCSIQAAQRGRWGPPILPLKHVYREQAMTRRLFQGWEVPDALSQGRAGWETCICLPKHLFQSIPYQFSGFALEKAMNASVQEHSQVRKHTDNVPKKVISQPTLHDGNQKLWKSRLPHYFR